MPTSHIRSKFLRGDEFPCLSPRSTEISSIQFEKSAIRTLLFYQNMTPDSENCRSIALFSTRVRNISREVQ